MAIRSVRASRVNEGDALNDGPARPPLYVVEVSSNSLGDVVLRCAYTPDPDAYPGVTLLRRPDELLEVEV